MRGEIIYAQNVRRKTKMKPKHKCKECAELSKYFATKKYAKYYVEASKYYAEKCRCKK